MGYADFSKACMLFIRENLHVLIFTSSDVACNGLFKKDSRIILILYLQKIADHSDRAV
jgi:hypothetical protein